MKTCKRCDTAQPMFAYRKDARYADGHSTWCKACHYQVARSRLQSTGAHISNLISQAKTRASKKGVPFALTKDDITIPAFCPALGIPLVRNSGRKGPSDNSPTIDRIDPAKGYVPGNVVVVSFRANKIKSNASVAELMAVYAYMEKQSHG